MTAPANNAYEEEVSFGITFATPPIVVVSLMGMVYPNEVMPLNIKQDTISTTGFTVRGRNNYSQALPVTIMWIAVEK